MLKYHLLPRRKMGLHQLTLTDDEWQQQSVTLNQSLQEQKYITFQLPLIVSKLRDSQPYLILNLDLVPYCPEVDFSQFQDINPMLLYVFAKSAIFVLDFPNTYVILDVVDLSSGSARLHHHHLSQTYSSRGVESVALIVVTIALLVLVQTHFLLKHPNDYRPPRFLHEIYLEDELHSCSNATTLQNAIDFCYNFVSFHVVYLNDYVIRPYLVRSSNDHCAVLLLFLEFLPTSPSDIGSVEWFLKTLECLSFG
mmetsp:Transcript_38913/g.44416  ORF Transcript_38913/g.44416 Transcript_38913/m.44416 type:complete len:252 (-) Transcript_38913:283-1038(-)